MKSGLLSIRPEWCGYIAKGEKTVEIRKDKPNLELPFKCYIYCTKSKKMQFWTNQRYAYADDHSHNIFDRCGNGKVIGEFVCDEIFPIVIHEHGSILNYNLYHMSDSRVPYEDIATYIGYGNVGYGWCISDLVIYSEPKELDDFWAVGKCPYMGVTGCTNTKYDCVRVGSRMDSNCGKRIAIPPQKWRYVDI